MRDDRTDRAVAGFDPRFSGLAALRVFALRALPGLILIGDRHERF
jgi:hypothetical protein